MTVIMHFYGNLAQVVGLVKLRKMVKNVFSTSSVCIIHHSFLVSTTSSNHQACWCSSFLGNVFQWLLLPGGSVHLVRHSSYLDFPQRNPNISAGSGILSPYCSPFSCMQWKIRARLGIREQVECSAKTSIGEFHVIMWEVPCK